MKMRNWWQNFQLRKRATDSVLIHSISSACDRLPHRVQVQQSLRRSIWEQSKKKNGSLAPINIPTSTFDSFLKCAREGVINSWIESAVQVWSVQEVTTKKIQATAAFDVHNLSRTQTDRYTPTKWLRGDIALPHGGDKCGHIRNWIFVLNLSPGLGCFCCDIWRVMEISYQSKSSSFKDYLRPETHTHTYTF